MGFVPSLPQTKLLLSQIYGMKALLMFFMILVVLRDVAREGVDECLGFAVLVGVGYDCTTNAYREKEYEGDVFHKENRLARWILVRTQTEKIEPITVDTRWSIAYEGYLIFANPYSKLPFNL